MEKGKNFTKSSISPQEYELIQKVVSSGLTVFSPDDVSRLLGWGKERAYRVIHNLKKKGIATSLQGKYVISPMFHEYNPLVVASCVVWPSYISFWTALNFYKFTEQLPRTIFVATTRQKKKLEFDGNRVRFVQISGKRFFGYQEINGIIIAEKEKAFLDSLLLSRYSGGITEISKCLRNAWDELDKEKLVQYSLKMGNKSLVKRLGYLIQSNNLRISEELLYTLKKSIGKGYSKLDPQPEKRGNRDDEWQLILNV